MSLIFFFRESRFFLSKLHSRHTVLCQTSISNIWIKPLHCCVLLLQKSNFVFDVCTGPWRTDLDGLDMGRAGSGSGGLNSRLAFSLVDERSWDLNIVCAINRNRKMV
jgi:hypothetical protein